MKINFLSLRFFALFGFLGLVFAGFSSGFFQPIFFPKNQNPVDSLKKKFNQYQKNWPGERVFLQTDKPIYDPGETVWFSAFLVDQSQMSLPGLSEILYVELINPKGSVEKKISLIARGGKANGDFLISEDLPGGPYKLKAYTHWMEQQNQFVERNFQVQQQVLPVMKLSLELDKKAYKSGQVVEADFLAHNLENQAIANTNFEYTVVADGKSLVSSQLATDGSGKKKITFVLPEFVKGSKPVLNIQIQNQGETESISRTIPVLEEDMLVFLFPEGGDFIVNQNSKIAFKVLKADSTPADAEGWLVNGKGEKLKMVKSFHDGMGFFEIRAQAGEKYKIEWQSPVKQITALPEPLEKGYGLATQSDGESLKIKFSAPAKDNLILVAQMRGKWLWSKSVQASENQTELSTSTQTWPSGLAVISLFDERDLLRCERRVFVNPGKKLNVSLKTDQESYKTRDKVNLSLRISDQKGIPVPGAAMVSVVNDALLTYADDKQSNLAASLLLEQELDTKLENPNFYFSDLPKAKAALDLVMMTYGWRGISWKKITENLGEKPGFKPEKAVISGTIQNPQTGKGNPGVKLEVGGTVVYTDTNGRFKFPLIDLSKPAKLKISKGKEAAEEQFINQYGEDFTFYYPNYRVMYEMKIAEGAMPLANMAVAEMDADVKMPRGKILPRKMAPAPKGGEALNKKEKQMAGAELEEIVLPKPMMRRAFPVPPLPQPENSPYYLARKFPNIPPAKTKERTDFATTLFWSGIVDLDLNGRGSFSFYTKDDLSSYKAVAHAIGPDGLLGTSSCLFSTVLPFSISSKIPFELSVGDKVSLPVTVKNKTGEKQKFSLSAEIGKGLKETSAFATEVELAPGESREIPFQLTAFSPVDSAKIKLSMASGPDKDIWEKSIRIVPKGYPVELAFSGREMQKYFIAEVKNLVSGSMKVHATAYPDVTSDLLAGVESILAEPFGCFEQTSMTSYPNVLVLNYLGESNSGNKALVQNAEALLEKGYKKLTSFETKQKGYEWFGGTPAHEALTAYGLMQFKEMQKVAPYVDAGMIDRTANWLMSRRDGKGGFLRSPQALDNFGRANDDITNAYIVYSLAEAGFQQLEEEVKKTTETALEKKDPYLLALAANTLWLLKKEEKAREVTQVLIRLQAENGSWTGLSHSITYSTGEALTVETTSFGILALIRSVDGPKAKIDKAVSFLCAQRQGKGGFGNSQATIVALKALTAYVVFSKKAAEDGAFALLVNDKEVGKADWKAGTQNAISVLGWESEVKEGPNKLEFRYSVLKDPLPFTIGIQYHTFLPPTDPGCKVQLSTRLSGPKAKVGKPVQMEINLSNPTNEGLPMTMACISIPAGCVASPVELRELMQSKKVDFYEIKGNKIFLYYRQMKPLETKKVILTLNPAIKGIYESSASSAYLYYTAERKIWAEGLKFEIE